MRYSNLSPFYWFLLLVVFVPNILTSGLVELTYDEAYYWMYSKYLSWGYFDHPPMVAILIGLGTLIFGDTEIGVRLLPNILLLTSLLVMWSMVEKKNLLAFALLFLTMPLINFSGVFSLPDSALLLTSVFYFYALKKFVEKDTWISATLLAFAIAFMFYSKYHGLLIVLLSLFGHLKFLKNKKFWYIAIASALLFLPHIWWQFQNDWVSFKFHLFGRVEKHFSFSNVWNYISGQILLMGFLNFFLVIAVLKKFPLKNTFEKILFANSFGFLGFLLLMSLRNQIEANWTISCSVALILLAVPRLGDYYRTKLWKTSFISLLLVLTMRMALLGAHYIKDFEMEHENRINEIVGWKEERIPLIKKFCGPLPIVAENYQYAAKVSFYTGQVIPSIHLGSRKSHYTLLNLEQDIKPNENICFLTTKKLGNTIKIDTFFKDPIYILTPTNLNFLAKLYNTTYEEIIRN